MNLAEILIESIETEISQARVVLEKAKEVDLDFSPGYGLKSLKDLANHLVQIPKMDRRIFTMDIKKAEEAQELEKKLKRDSIHGMLEVLDSGTEELVEFFKDASHSELLEKKITPFYMKDVKESLAHYLQEMATHIAMHKMQVWMYLKLAGKDVDMMTYYGVKKD
ncbi:MAG: hypothetical protein BAJATHORv1_100050 [Candidatus Thorarchaeota archaeon]|nr:MAG: hypothetical protein BAJATHORv1_100050 [Candidatus Thorarchaeota archaeon]